MTLIQTACQLGLAYGALALGIYISMRIFRIPDITTDGSFTLGGSITAVLALHGQPIWMILPAAFVSGYLAGMLTGWIHTKLNVNALLSGILVSSALYSVNLAILGRSNIPLIGVTTPFSFLQGIGFDPTILVLGVLMAVVVIGVTYLLRTDFGLTMRSTGNNEIMIRSLGVNTDRMKMIGLGIANGLVALSGCLITYVQGFADINMGIGIILIGLGAVIIGERLLGWNRHPGLGLTLVAVVLGSVLFRGLLAAALTVGIDPLYLKLVVAVFVLLTVSLPRSNRAT